MTPTTKPDYRSGQTNKLKMVKYLIHNIAYLSNLFTEMGHLFHQLGKSTKRCLEKEVKHF